MDSNGPKVALTVQSIQANFLMTLICIPVILNLNDLIRDFQGLIYTLDYDVVDI